MRNTTILALVWTVIVGVFICCEKTAYDAEKSPAQITRDSGLAEVQRFRIAQIVEASKPKTAKDSLDAATAKLLTEIWQCERDIRVLKQKPTIRAGSSLEVLHGPPQ